ncbi:MAG: hypothetical protein WC873_01035 [Candidatus Gracilibacteria bacterium]
MGHTKTLNHPRYPGNTKPLGEKVREYAPAALKITAVVALAIFMVKTAINHVIDSSHLGVRGNPGISLKDPRAQHEIDCAFGLFRQEFGKTGLAEDLWLHRDCNSEEIEALKAKAAGSKSPEQEIVAFRDQALAAAGAENTDKHGNKRVKWTASDDAGSKGDEYEVRAEGGIVQ